MYDIHVYGSVECEVDSWTTFSKNIKAFLREVGHRGREESV